MNKNFLTLYKKQAGCCAICYTSFDASEKSVQIDHNPTTGKIRGLLCKNCNTGLRKFKEDIESLQRAVFYIESEK